MRLRRAGLAALLLPGAFLLLLVVLAVTTAATYALWAATATGDDRLEALRWSVAWALVKVFGVKARPAHARAMMAILGNELPPNWTPGMPVEGDVDLAGGPSIGPGQVYRKTAKELGLWTPPGEGMTDEEERAAYRILAVNEPLMLEWAAKVFKSKLAAAEAAAADDADEAAILADAVRRYNGGGDQARKYRDRALAAAAGWWGGLVS